MSATNPDGLMGSPDGEIEAAAAAAGAPSICPAIDNGAEAESGEATAEPDAFAGNAEDIAADETRRKIELFAWADSVLELNEADLELALDGAAKHFKMTRASLKRIITARRSEKFKAKTKAERSRAEPDDGKDNVKYYSPDFKVSDRGVFARKFDDHGHPFWDKICTTRIDLEALTRDGARGKLGHLYHPHQPRRGEEKARSPSCSHRCRQSCGHRQPAGFARRRNCSIAPGSSTPRAVPHARGKRAHNCGASDRLALQRRPLGCSCSPTTPSCLLDLMVRGPSYRQRACMCSMVSTCAGVSSNGSSR